MTKIAKEQTPEPEYLRPSEVARRLSLSLSMVYNLVENGDLPSIKIGRSIRIEAKGLTDWITQKRKG